MAMNDNLFKAILAMDAYNRGYDANIKFGTLAGTVSLDAQGTQIGNATILDSNGNAAAQDIGFYALAYTYNGETVISYRGTDYPENDTTIPKDVQYGWTLGAGDSDSPQGLMAIQFYKDIANLAALPGSQNVYLDANISLTGHSLGGGLAGMVASLYGQDAKIYDSMEYDGGVVDIVAVTNPQSLSYDEDLKTLIYESSQPWSPDNSGVTASNVEGEALGFIRISNSNSLSLGADVDLGSVDRHSASLLVIRTFAETELGGVTDWQSAGKYFWPVLYDDAFAKSLNVGSVDNQTRQDGDYNGVLRDIIAYSAINEGTRVFGDTGIRAFYNDANDLGAVQVMIFWLVEAPPQITY